MVESGHWCTTVDLVTICPPSPPPTPAKEGPPLTANHLTSTSSQLLTLALIKPNLFKSFLYEVVLVLTDIYLLHTRRLLESQLNRNLRIWSMYFCVLNTGCIDKVPWIILWYMNIYSINDPAVYFQFSIILNYQIIWNVSVHVWGVRSHVSTNWPTMKMPRCWMFNSKNTNLNRNRYN